MTHLLNINLVNFLKNNKNISWTSDECCVCYEKFINIKCADLSKIEDSGVLNNICTHEDISYLSCYCIDERFCCIVCKNKFCLMCFQQIPARIEDEYNHDNGCEYTMEMTGIITCPICNTKDYRLKYHPMNCVRTTNYPNLFSEKLLNDIKNKKIKNKKKI
jgi:hypothetical protein